MKTSVAILLTLVVAAAFIAIHNYIECRQQGFSILYCSTTHLIR